MISTNFVIGITSNILEIPKIIDDDVDFTAILISNHLFFDNTKFTTKKLQPQTFTEVQMNASSALSKSHRECET